MVVYKFMYAYIIGTWIFLARSFTFHMYIVNEEEIIGQNKIYGYASFVFGLVLPLYNLQ